MQRCNPGIDTEQTVVSCLELSVALEGTQSGGEGSCASYGGAALVADGIQHSLPCYSVSALILAGIVPHLPWSEARGWRQRLPGISCTMPQGHASSSDMLPTQAPKNLLEAPRLLGTAQASAPCQYLLRCDAHRCFQQRGDRSSPSAAAATSSSTILPLAVRQQPQGMRIPMEGLILPQG